MMLLGFTDDLVAEHDPDLPFRAATRHRLESRFRRRLRGGARDIAFEARHQEEQADRAERPQDQDDEKEQLIGSHAP